MLALTDSQLARLCIGATAVAPEDRCRWLRDIAERLDPLPRRLALARKARARPPAQGAGPAAAAADPWQGSTRNRTPHARLCGDARWGSVRQVMAVREPPAAS
jgi:hypothetical protein